MIPISWTDIVAGSRAAAVLGADGLSASEVATLEVIAKGIASVIGSSIESPGAGPIVFDAAEFGTVSADTATITEATFDAIMTTLLYVRNADGYKVLIKASDSMTLDWTFTLPTTDGAADQVLRTNGSGVTSWVDQTGGGGTQSFARTFAMMGA